MALPKAIPLGFAFLFVVGAAQSCSEERCLLREHRHLDTCAVIRVMVISTAGDPLVDGHTAAAPPQWNGVFYASGYSKREMGP